MKYSQIKKENDMAGEVPFPSTNYILKHHDMHTDIAANVIPEYLRGLAEKHNMHFKLVYDIEMAMFNEKCCLIFGDDWDRISIGITFLEEGKRVEYGVTNFLVSKFDDSDREGIEPSKFFSQNVRNELTVIARGLESKWSSLLDGDMSWFEHYKCSSWYSERQCFIEERNKILDEIVAWQQGQLSQ